MWNWTCSSRRPTWRGRSDAGVALPGVLLLAAFLVGVTGWLVGHLRTDVALDRRARGVAPARASRRRPFRRSPWRWRSRPTGPAWMRLRSALACPAAPAVVAPLDEAVERGWLQARDGCRQPVGRRHARVAAGLAVPRRRRARAAGRRGARHPPWSSGSRTIPKATGSRCAALNQRLLVTAVARAPERARGAASATVSRASPGAPVELAAWRVAASPEV